MEDPTTFHIAKTGRLLLPSQIVFKRMKGQNHITSSKSPDKMRVNNVPIYELMDIALYARKYELNILNNWKSFLLKFHFIIIYDVEDFHHSKEVYSKFSRVLQIPHWVQYELYDKNDIKNTLKDNYWIIPFRNPAMISFAYLISDKRYILTIDEHCLPIPRPMFSLSSNPISQHIINLVTPATSYPLSSAKGNTGDHSITRFPPRRAGIATAISHGLLLQSNDTSLTAALSAILERGGNSELGDVTQTVPRGALYSLHTFNMVSLPPRLFFAIFVFGSS